jgi:hypothetical protein
LITEVDGLLMARINFGLVHVVRISGDPNPLGGRPGFVLNLARDLRDELVSVQT